MVNVVYPVAIAVPPLLTGKLSRVEYVDTIDDEMDGLTLTFSSMISAPGYGEKMKMWIGFGPFLTYIGTFYVAGWRERFEQKEIEYRLTPVDLTGGIKEKRTHSYEHMTLTKILEEIGGRYGLGVRNDLDDVAYPYKAQTHESDLEFLRRLAKENNASFGIKNDTIVFRAKSLSEHKDKLPKVYLDLTQTAELELEHMAKTDYKSAEAKYHDIGTNTLKTVKVGEGEPKLVVEGHFKMEAEAKKRAKAEMERSNAGKIRGTCTVTTAQVIAGALLTLNLFERGVVEDLQIREVRHEIEGGEGGGYKKHVSFTQ